MKRLAPVLIFFCACSSGSVESPDAAPNADATVRPDATSGDATGSDAIAVEDSGPSDSGGDRDAGVDPDASQNACNTPAQIETVFGDRFATPVTFELGSPMPVTVTPRAEAGEFTASFAGKTSAADGYEWHAQVTHFTMFDSLRVEAAVEDPADGSTYVAYELQVSTSTRTVFYNADGSIAGDFTAGGDPGEDITGRSRQSNFFLVKYSSVGRVLWISRFGPNDPGGDRAGHVSGIGLVPGGVRVIGAVEGSARLIFAPRPNMNNFEYAAPRATGFWAEFSRADGTYVMGSARFIESNAQEFSSGISYHGKNSTNAAFESSIAGTLFRRTGMAADVVIGAQGTNPITVTTTQAITFFAKVGASGAPEWVGRGISSLGFEIRAHALAESGELIAGGQFSARAGTAFFRGETAEVSLAYGEQESFLVSFSGGEPRWAKRIISRGRNTISEINVTQDAVYLMGAGSATDTTFGPGEANETRYPGATGGYFLAKFSLASGDFQWVRSFEGGDAYISFDSGNELIVPARFMDLTIAGGAGDLSLEADNTLSILRFGANGDFLGCSVFARGIGPYGLFTPR